MPESLRTSLETIEACPRPAVRLDGRELTPRIQRLRELALSWANEPDPTERGWAVMRSYDETVGQPIIVRRAKAVAAFLMSETLQLDEGDFLAGKVRRQIPGHRGIHEGHNWVNAAGYPDLWWRPGPLALKGAPVSEEFLAYMRQWVTRHPGIQQDFNAQRPVETQRDMAAGLFAAHGFDGNHRLPRYQLLLDRGCESLKYEALDRMAKAPSDQRDFYEALVIAYDAVMAYGKRWETRLNELAEAEPDETRRMELRQMAEHCGWALAKPARTFWEAIQTVWLGVCINQAECTGSAGSIGRLDQYLYPYYKADIEAGRITRERALELIEVFWLKCYRTFDFHHTTLGGQTPDGRDATNELSYLCLDAVAALRTPRDVAVRIHRNTPPAFLRRAVEVAALGLGRPDFWCDEITIESLVKKGIPIKDARDYAPIGCVEMTIPGKCNSRTMGHAINLSKILEVTLNGGRCALTGKRAGLDNEIAFPTYESLHAAYRRQVANAIRLAIEENFRAYAIQREQMPMPLLSAFTIGCMESGRDVMDGGAVYNPAGVNLFTVANVADSLAAIRKLVYDEKRLTLDDLRDALRTNFEGREDLRQMLLSAAPKFGNDDPYVDAIAAEEVAFYCDEVDRYPTPEGGRHWPLLFGTTTQSIYQFGPKTGASADGRRAKEILATSVNPMSGRNTSGLTAELNSVSRIDYTKAAGGCSYITDIHPTVIDGDECMDKMCAALRAFFERGGMEIGLNVLREDQLRQAQADPEKHAHIMVRVFGFSTQFVSLDPEWQEYVISKVRHKY
ncbi:MAG: pyruvate formate lyase family protein [Planctomycetota bacterium]